LLALGLRRVAAHAGDAPIARLWSPAVAAQGCGRISHSFSALVQARGHYRNLRNSPLKPAFDRATGEFAMHILWIVLIGFIAGIVARNLLPGPNNPAGFILTTLLGIAGAFVATYLGQHLGWYRLDQGAGFIGATLGAVIVLFVWHRLVVTRTVTDPTVANNGLGPRRWL